ncbi:MAG: FAD-binding protein [Pirellulales bacterium]|nr:FAD-binding protein [Pirellulales bacterium]
MSQLDQQRMRIQDDLRGLIAGEVRCDDVFSQLYAGDAGIYEIKPLGVVRPRSTADLSACVKYAAEKRIPLHARGAGSGVAGQSLGPGLVVDFSTHLRRIIRIDDDRVLLQPGVVHERLNAQLRRRGRVFGPDSAVGAVSTVGGMIAVNAAGSRWLKYGSTSRCVQGLQVVLADGEVLELGREPLVGGRSASSIPRKRELIDRLAALLREKDELIRGGQPNCPENHCGYNLAGVLSEDAIDVARLLVGSEGTLALTTEAVLSTDLLPRHRGVALLFFDGMDKAARAVPDVLAHGPSACDLMDRRHLSIARETESRFERLIPVETEALLLVEQDDDDPRRVRERLHRLVGELWQRKRFAFGARQAFEDDEAQLFWRLVNKVQSALYRMSGPTRPLPVVEDMAVAPQSLPDFIPRVQNVLKRNRATASLYCHAGQGQLHVQPFFDLSDADDVRRMRLLAEGLYEETLAVGGSIGGEHGCGLSRTPFVRRQSGKLFDVFLEVKKIFDAENILNPGKIVGDDAEMATRHIRPAARSFAPLRGGAASEPEKMRDLLELQLDWDPASVADAVAKCNRCGECRTQDERFRMCPLFRALPAEEASPRAKVNLLGGILSGALDLELLTEDEFKAVADLCVHCHCCRLECPAKVDVPRLMRESKGAFTAANGLSLTERAMIRLDLLAAWGGLLAPAANWALGNRQMRWLLEKTLGIAQGRKLPRVASRTFMRRAARRRLTRPSRHGGRKILYFVDIYANYFDPGLAEAAVAVLEHNRVSVFVHPDQKQAGMPAIACGALDHARRLAAHNVALLAEAVRQGYHVVATEPAAALCLRHEYPQLLENDDARLVAENSSEVGGFLWDMHRLGNLQLDLSPLNLTLGYHAPCHLKALEEGCPGEKLLGLIPGLRVQRIESGCSGMAGTFGLTRKNYRASLRAGLKLIARLRDPVIQAGATECSACKTQMEQGTDKPTLHPIVLLALSYGLIPKPKELGL